MKTLEPDYDFVMRVLKLAERWDMYDNLTWITYEEYAPITFFINCSDLFFWGTADEEKLTPENIEQLEMALKDAEDACKYYGHIYGPILWCARMRKQRPQGAAYPSKRELWPLFDACGPERKIGFGNPSLPGDRV